MSFLDTLKKYSPRTQLLLALGSAVAIGAAGIGAYFAFLNHPYVAIYSDLRPADAASLVSDLEKKKIPYRLDEGGGRILVPSDQADNARVGLADDDPSTRGEVGFELFNKSDMGLTEFAQRINYQRALQGELARTIMTMDPIEAARVHLTLAEPTIFRDDRTPSKASVTVSVRPGQQLTAQTIEGIQQLVAGAVPDLAAADVAVLNEDGDVVSGSPANLAVVSPKGQEEAAIGQFYAAKLRQALAGLLPAEATVTVDVRADPSPVSIEGDGKALDAWSADKRGFPITATIGLPAPPSASVDHNIRQIASVALGLDPARGDVLTIQAGPSESAASGPADRELAQTWSASRSGAAPPQLEARRDLSWLVDILLAFVLVLGGVVLFLQRWRGARSLSQGQRAALAARLSALLDESEGHASSIP